MYLVHSLQDIYLNPHTYESGIATLSPIPSVYNIPAILADVRVEMMPDTSADMATLETSPERLGAIWDKTPICVPSEPILPKPYIHVKIIF